MVAAGLLAVGFEGMTMAEKIMRPGVWLRRGDRLAVAVQLDPKADHCRWRGSDGKCRYDDGRYYPDQDSEWDLVEWLDVPDAAEELAALKDDRDRWQARAKQAEGRATSLARDVLAVGAERDELQKQLAAAQIQLREATQQLEAAAHAPDLRGEVERVAAERDAAREEVRGLQVRAEQAEGDARQANGKLGHVEGEAVRWKAQVTVKNDQLLRSEAAVDALRSVILDLFERLRNDD